MIEESWRGYRLLHHTRPREELLNAVQMRLRRGDACLAPYYPIDLHLTDALTQGHEA